MKYNRSKYIISAVAFLFLYACTKNTGITNQSYDVYGISSSSGQLKINLATSYTVDYNTMLIKINDKVVSGSLQTRTPFPGGGYNTRGSNYALYLTVPLGANKVSLLIPKKATSEDSIVLYTTSITIPDNAPYTLHIADTLSAAINKTKSVLVKNEISDMDTGYCRFKFVNLIPNVAAVDLYLNDVKLKSAIPYLGATDSFSVKTGVNAPGYKAGVVTTWAVRIAGALPTSKALASYGSANGLQSQRVLTVFCLGYAGFTGTKLPYVSLTLDKNN